MQTNSDDIRFELILFHFPDESAIRLTSQLIYESQDKNLIASLSSTPYTVGRSFSRTQQERLYEDLKALNVGFSFRSKPPYQENFQFDPRQSENPEATESGLKISRQAVAFALSIVVVIVVGLFALRWAPTTTESTSKSPAYVASTEKKEILQDGSYDARLAQIKPKVEYRSSEDLFWKEASKGQELKLEDAVRTFSKAFAIIRYVDGSFVSLRENTLLVVGETSQSPETGTQREVELKDGSLQARLQASEERQRLSIKTPRGVLEISNQDKEQASSTQVSTSFQNGELQIAVSEGAAHFVPKNKTASSFEIKKFQKIVQKPKEEPKLLAYEPEIQIYRPAQDEHLKLYDTGQNQFIFEWESIGPSVEYEWTLWSDEAQTNLLLSQRTSNTSLDLSYLDVGSLYWKVEAVKDGIRFSTPLFRIYVEKHHN